MSQRVIVLSGENISLVVPERQDLDLWYKGMNNIEISKNLVYNFGKIYYRENEEEFYEKLVKDEDSITFSIYLNIEKKTIGNISLNKIDKLSRNSELGISIFEEDKLGKGYGSEAIKLILKYAFNVLGLNKVYLRYISLNQRGKKAYEKVGFNEVGRLKNHWYVMGEYYDDVIMEIFKEKYLLTK